MNSPSGSPKRLHSTDHVVVFDGLCQLCDRFVRWLIRRDRSMVLKLAHAERSAETVLFWTRGQWFKESDAVLEIGRKLWPHLLWFEKAGLLVLWITPRSVRNAGYRIVARYRVRWFGRRHFCEFDGERGAPTSFYVEGLRKRWVRL